MDKRKKSNKRRKKPRKEYNIETKFRHKNQEGNKDKIEGSK